MSVSFVKESMTQSSMNGRLTGSFFNKNTTNVLISMVIDSDEFLLKLCISLNYVYIGDNQLMTVVVVPVVVGLVVSVT